MSEERVSLQPTDLIGGETVDLAYIGRALHGLTNEVASLRDDMNVLTAIALRVGNTVTRVLDELRAIHTQHARLAERARVLGDHSPSP
jgi:hypothetical protein